jgi:hypothetical protein
MVGAGVLVRVMVGVAVGRLVGVSNGSGVEVISDSHVGIKVEVTTTGGLVTVAGILSPLPQAAVPIRKIKFKSRIVQVLFIGFLLIIIP